MIALSLRALWAHKRRLVATVMAVAIGVSFLAGTMILTDTTRGTFDDLFDQVSAGTDVVVRPAKPAEVRAAEADDSASMAVFDTAVADRVAAVPGVAAARAHAQGFGRLVGSDGKPVGGMGPPTQAGTWIDDPRLNPYALAEGRAPVTDTEVVVNRGAAATAGLRVGDRAVVQTPAAVPVTVVGLARFGEADSAGGVTFVGFTLDGAQRHVLGRTDRVTSVAVAGDGTVPADELVRRVAAVLPAGVEAVSGTQVADEQKQAIGSDFLNFLEWFLRAFAAIALLVVAFTIHNTFSILGAQRTRESALLRALGATRRQILASALVETVAVGVVASAIGVVAGIGLSMGLRRVFALLGADLPAGDLVLAPATVGVALAVGTVVTILAGYLPARRSSRVAPLAALRDVAVDGSGRSRVRLVVGTLATLVGGAVVLQATLTVSAGDDTAGVMLRTASGAVVGLVGIILLGPLLVRLVSPVLGWPIARTGPSGAMARQNAGRNPRRTSATALALMIGVTVVVMFTVMAQSMKASVRDTLGRSFAGDLVVSTGGGGLPPQLAADLHALPEVRAATGLGGGLALVEGKRSGLNVVDPGALSQILDLKVEEGSLADLAPGQLAVSRAEADAHGWRLGSTVPVAFLDGAARDMTVGAVFAEGDLVDGILMRRDDWAPHAIQDRDFVVIVGLHNGADMAAAKAAAERVTAGQAGVEVQDRDQFVESAGQGINQMLVLVYVMLALAIVIALLGIANTLALSIHERTRELGLLRAVGQTRRQVRAMVRGESVIVALFGTALGIGLGLFLGWALVRAASSEGVGTFSAAPGQLAVIALVGAVAGVLAALRPARRAARLDVLQAIATD